MFTKQTQEDSLTLDNYVLFGKKQSLHLKKLKKDEMKRERKNSAQLSIFTWINQHKTSQNCSILIIDKYLLLKVFSFLRVSEVVRISRVCTHFLMCSRALWNDRQYFSQLSTDKLTSKELGQVMQKSSRLDHIRQLKNLYSGKNINLRRQKIKIKIGDKSSRNEGILQYFSVTPNVKQGSTFILDSHLKEIVASSFRSLKVIQLIKCGLIKNVGIVSKCTELNSFSITHNDYFKSEELGMICQKCKYINKLYIYECRSLDENIFEHIQFLQFLITFTLKAFRQSFFKLRKLQRNGYLKEMDLEGSLINDIQAFQITKISTLEILSIKNCPMLTNSFVSLLLEKVEDTKLKTIRVSRGNFEEQTISKLNEKIEVI